MNFIPVYFYNLFPLKLQQDSKPFLQAPGNYYLCIVMHRLQGLTGGEAQ